MPKKTYKMLRFDGGIGNDSDPRDIGDNQFVALDNVAVDEMGKIKVLGDAKTSYKAMGGGSITAEGTGLFAFRTDYDGFVSGGVDIGGRTYFIAENGSNLRTRDSDGTEAAADIAISNLSELNAYYVNGALRVFDGNHADTPSTPTWRGYISAKTLGTQTSSDANATRAANWYTYNATIDGAFPTFTYNSTAFCKNAIVCNTQNAAAVSPGYNFDGISFDGFVNTGTGAMSVATSDHYWGLALEYDEGANGTGSWMPETTIRYRFYVTTMYDDHSQESLPQELVYKTTDVLKASTTNQYSGKYISKSVALSNDKSNTPVENVAVAFRPVLKINNAATENFRAGNGNTGNSSAGNHRISGFRIYWSSSQDTDASLWQLCDMHLIKGVKMIGLTASSSGGYTPWTACSGSQDEGGAATGRYLTPVGLTTHTTSVAFENPPRYLRYDVLNMHAHDEEISVTSAKTSVLANNRVYIGNVQQDGEIYGDRMLKSGVMQYDKFPKDSNQIDVAIHDGDEIITMVEFADRILQFKKNTLYIINVSGNSEFLESENKHKGVTNPGAVCRTDYGMAWINSHGCFIYDGSKVTDLLEAGGLRKINKAAWNTFIGTANHHRIGFNTSKKQLIVKSGDANTTGHVYDLTTQAWTYSTTIIEDANTKSNFINNPDNGELLILDESSNTLDKWTDGGYSGQEDKTINITTKDIDFGEPAVRKKVYKVYITYKVNDATVPALYYDTDGNTTLTTAATATTAFTNTSGQWTRAEYKFGSDTNSCYSIQLKISGAVDRTFEINDITFIYRVKNVK